jgi:branched-chain amino acid transport system ATP-binding protein
VLEVKDLSVAYGGLRALTRVTLSVAEGRFVTIVGPNGAGKSTLFKTISGVVPPLSGTITFRNESLLSHRPSDRAHLGIAHVPEGRQVFKTLTVRENLEMGAYPKTGRTQWTQTLERIHTLFPILAERADQLAGTLSGGEQQMLAIGRGLACAPRLLMLDEPSMGLAPMLVQEIFEIVGRLNREEKVAVLLAEQNANMALRFAQYVYVMENGRVVLDGDVKAVSENEDIKEFYLGLSGVGQRKSYRDVKHYKRRKRWLS